MLAHSRFLRTAAWKGKLAVLEGVSCWRRLYFVLLEFLRYYFNSVACEPCIFSVSLLQYFRFFTVRLMLIMTQGSDEMSGCSDIDALLDFQSCGAFDCG